MEGKQGTHAGTWKTVVSATAFTNLTSAFCTFTLGV